MDLAQHEQVVFCRDAASGLRAIIAIHNTTLGPAVGGTRMWPYASEEEALIDVLRLSEGMTYKAAVTGLNLGGGKAVIIGDPKRDKSEALLRAHGRFVDSLGGRYVTAEDVGITVQDMEYVYMETPFVTGVASAPGGGGDPSPVTAFGVYHGIKAAAKKVWGSPDLAGRSVAIQGVGSVGGHLAQNLAAEGVRLHVSDIDPARVQRVVQETGATAVAPEEIFGLDVDVFAPCALGAILNDRTIPQLRCRIVAGGANNQLAEHRHGDELMRRGILYAPDFVINAGGLINVYSELQGYDPVAARNRARGIYDTLLAIFERAEADGIPTYQAAERLAEARILEVSRAGRIYTPRHRRPPARFARL
ncbi:MAG TPA: Glu/Leu/Phe/Val dehydrogenase dimerization domain-containing protein [Gemmatimonadota bacterium]